MGLFFIMVGTPGAGKTTFVKKYLPSIKYLGTDQIRKQLLGKELTLRKHRQVHAVLHKQIKKAIRKGEDIVVDCMNITRAQRRVLLSLIPPDYKTIVFYMDTPFLQTLRQNWMRSRHVPVLGITFFYLIREEPKKEEGFFKIIRITPDHPTRKWNSVPHGNLHLSKKYDMVYPIKERFLINRETP